jgi:hypothetical protein
MAFFQDSLPFSLKTALRTPGHSFIRFPFAVGRRPKDRGHTPL